MNITRFAKAVAYECLTAILLLLSVLCQAMLHGEGGVDLEIHRYVDPAGVPRPPMQHNEIGSMHFMLRVQDMQAVVDKVTALGYPMMTPIVQSEKVPGFKYAYFRGPDGMMVELHEGDLPEAGRVRPLPEQEAAR